MCVFLSFSDVVFFGVSFVYSFVVFFSVFVFHGRCLILVFRVSLSFSVFVFSFFVGFISDSRFSFSSQCLFWLFINAFRFRPERHF